MFVISSISPTRLGGCSGITIDQTFLQRKCRMALESIRGGYRGGAQCTQASSQIAMGSNYPSKIVLANRQTPPGIAALEQLIGQ